MPAVGVSRCVTRASVRWCGGLALLFALAGGVWLQRSTVIDAVSELRSMSVLAIGALLVMAGFERWVRADIVRTLMNTSGPARGTSLTFTEAITVHDVGTAASKALPLGGAVGTAMRWSISRSSGVTAPRFTSVFVVYGLASTVIAWALPLVFLLIDVAHGSGDRNDWLLIAGISAVLGTSLIVGAAMLRSDRVEASLTMRLGRLSARLRRRRSARRIGAATMSPKAVGIVRSELRTAARSPWALVAKTCAAQASGALILLISLRSLGVGAELGVIEFARVYFVAQLLGSFVPTPGGVGVVEAGLTGALVAAGVDVRLALAAVLVYRLITYVLPIAVGFVLYLRWRVNAVEPVGLELVETKVSIGTKKPTVIAPTPALAAAS